MSTDLRWTLGKNEMQWLKNRLMIEISENINIVKDIDLPRNQFRGAATIFRVYGKDKALTLAFFPWTFSMLLKTMLRRDTLSTIPMRTKQRCRTLHYKYTLIFQWHFFQYVYIFHTFIAKSSFVQIIHREMSVFWKKRL